MEREEEREVLVERVKEANVVNDHEIRRDIPVLIEEVKKQLMLGGPLVAVNLLLFCLQIVSLMFVGHVGELSLAGASMATSFAGVTGFSLMIGMSSALETFCGQAYGAKQHHMLGIYMQRAMLILSLTTIPITIIWLNTSQILISLNQDPEISIEAGSYAKWLVPSITSFALLQCQIRFLQAQNIVVPMVVTSGATALIHLPLCWILVFKCGLGSGGAALATGVSYWLNVGLLGVYMVMSPSCTTTWIGFSKEAFREIAGFLKLALPSALMICLESWCFEMLVLASGLLPNPKLQTSVLSISHTTNGISFVMASALGSVASVRVSNELGAGRPKAAYFAIHVTMGMIITEMVIFGLCMIAFRDVMGRLYTNEEEVVNGVASMVPFIAISVFLDGCQCVLSGAVRGCGRQKIGVFVNLGAYYIVGIPSAIFFAFVLRIGGKGLWLGIICALLGQVALYLFITVWTNWEKEAKNARDRIASPTLISTEMTDNMTSKILPLEEIQGIRRFRT